MKQPTAVTSLVAFMSVLLFFGALLAAVNVWTAPRVAAYEQLQAEKNARLASVAGVLKPLFPDATSFEKLGSTAFHDSTADYFLAKKEGATIGYAIHTFGIGYQSVIHAIAGINPDFSIKTVRMIHEGETEGFGTRLWDEEFLKQFNGKKSESLQVITEGEGDNAIMALTAATISSRALTEDAVKTAILFLKKKFGK